VAIQREKAERLRELHEPGRPLVLVNAWDAASARTVATVPGCEAVATASWAVAAAHGLPDGEVLPRHLALAAIGRIAAAIQLPLTADLEAGYGATPAEVGETVAAALDAGAVGCNLEDGTGDPARPVRSADDHAERIAAAVEAGARAGVPVVVNARTDVYLKEVGDPAGRLEDALARGRASVAAGAACVFVPGVRDPETIGRLAREMGAPVSVLAGPASPPVAELARLGVARVSVGPGGMGLAMAALARGAADILAGGSWPADLGHRPPGG
jgi:2-methylisocitrate lyase-like PEP mutase family enzyme